MKQGFRSAVGTGMDAPRWPLAAILLPLVLFCVLAADLVFGGPLTHLDPAVTRWFAEHRSPVLTSLFQGLSAMHSTIGIDSMLAVTAAGLLLARRWRSALSLVACVQGAMLLNVLLKLAFARERPDYLRLVEIGTFSFPSGHALAATVWWSSAWHAASPWVEDRRIRVALACTAAALVVLTCLSRVYLGAHFLTDVIAGLSEGIVWVGLYRRLQPAAARLQASG